MENLLINNSKEKLSLNLIRIGDVINFEGPILTLFEDANNGHLYLFDWVDRDSKNNRWLVYRINTLDLLNFIQQKISHCELFKRSSYDNYFYIDIDNSYQLREFVLTQLLEVPKDYLPNNDSLFDQNDSPNYSKIFSFILKMLSEQKQKNEYSFGMLATNINTFSGFGNSIINEANYESYSKIGIEKFNVNIPSEMPTNVLNSDKETTSQYQQSNKIKNYNNQNYANAA